jgi:hypothetical protein
MPHPNLDQVKSSTQSGGEKLDRNHESENKEVKKRLIQPLFFDFSSFVPSIGRVSLSLS